MSPEKTEKDKTCMHAEKRLKWLRVVTRFMTFSAMGLAGISFFYLGPHIESRLFPVVPTFRVTDIQHMPDGSARVSGVMLKAFGRGHCEPVSIDAMTTAQDEPTKRVHIEFEPVPGQQWVARPEGMQHFGPWLLHPPEPPIGPIILIEAVHRCHVLWPVRQVLYEGLSSDFFPDN